MYCSHCGSKLRVAYRPVRLGDKVIVRYQEPRVHYMLRKGIVVDINADAEKLGVMSILVELDNNLGKHWFRAEDLQLLESGQQLKLFEGA